MKDYERLTSKNDSLCIDCAAIGLCRKTCIRQARYERLQFLEDKIESGELCDRKETAKEILRMIKDKGLLRYGGYLLHDSDFDTISKLYRGGEI